MNNNDLSVNGGDGKTEINRNDWRRDREISIFSKFLIIEMFFFLVISGAKAFIWFFELEQGFDKVLNDAYVFVVAPRLISSHTVATYYFNGTLRPRSVQTHII